MKSKLQHTLIIWACATLAGSAQAFSQNDTLTGGVFHEAIITTDAPKRHTESLQMGLHTLDSDDLLTMPVILGEPDLVKAIQLQPGVAQGVEGFSGLYVRGGENDQNLFLFDGLPLYQVSHLGGIFSSFNAASVSRADFYKAAFPAQYGGRVSSIVDIHSQRPDFKQCHGRFSIGLLSGNLFVTAPLRKDRTAFTAAVRRTWIDILSTPTLAVVNAIKKKNGQKINLGYAFTDANARIDHRFSPELSARIVGYFGHDRLKIADRDFNNTEPSYIITPSGPILQNPDACKEFYDEDRNRMTWGNWGTAASIDYTHEQHQLSATAYYSRYSSTYNQETELQYDMADPLTYGYSGTRTRNRIGDLGGRLDYRYSYDDLLTMRTGAGSVWHRYMPSDIRTLTVDGETETTIRNGNEEVDGSESYAYIEADVQPIHAIAVQGGLRAVAYASAGKSHFRLEPRASLRIMCGNHHSVKAAYSRMNQFAQQVSSNFANLPTDLWQPTATCFEPLESDLYTLGVYGNLPWQMLYSVEGWYKEMHHLAEFAEGAAPLNTALHWTEKLVDAKGWSYGLDVNVERTVGRLTGHLGYGLMWNWRKSPQLNHGEKFPAKFDNRHKVNIGANYKFNTRLELHAEWMFMTGNRMTLAVYNYDEPGSAFPDAPQTGNGDSGDADMQLTGFGYIGSRNNVRMPAYHRLDLSLDIHTRTRRGHKGTWNVGLYNAYCHMNAMTIIKDDAIYDDITHRRFRKFSLLPAVPSVSYSLEF